MPLEIQKGRIPKILGRPVGKVEGWSPDTHQCGSLGGRCSHHQKQGTKEGQLELSFERIEFRALRCFDIDKVTRQREFFSSIVILRNHSLYAVLVDQNVVIQLDCISKRNTHLCFSFLEISLSCLGLRTILAYRMSWEVFIYGSCMSF